MIYTPYLVSSSQNSQVQRIQTGSQSGDMRNYLIAHFEMKYIWFVRQAFFKFIHVHIESFHLYSTICFSSIHEYYPKLHFQIKKIDYVL